jgi:site-specific DNA recombinase
MQKFQIAIYSRKSKFTGKGESIENQIELCRQYIASHFPTEDLERIAVYEDEGFSGGNLDRPNFRAMMRDAEQKKIQAIVCYRLDRISRNISDFAALIEQLGMLKIGFISIKEQFDTSSPMGRAMMYIASVFSQLERETIAERIRDNMHELAKTGRWLGGVTPTGYSSESVERVTVDGKIKKACRLTLLPEEAKLVQLIFRVFLNTGSLTQTETFLLQTACKTKNGKHFSRFTLKNILTNPVYMIADGQAFDYLAQKEADLFSPAENFDAVHGIMAYNRTIQKAGRANELRPIKEWIIAVGKHPGLISGADWIRVQEKLEQNRTKGYRKPRSHDALLSGILFCSCGNYMRPKRSGRLNSRGEFQYTYLCALKEKSRSTCCVGKNINGNQLDQLVIDKIKQLSQDAETWKKRLAQMQRQPCFLREETQTMLEQLQGALTEKEQERKTLMKSLSKNPGDLAQEYILDQLNLLSEEKNALEQKVEEWKELQAAQFLPEESISEVVSYLSSFGQTFAALDVKKKRTALRSLVRKLIWDGETVHLYLLGAEEPGDRKPLCENSK